MLIKENKGYGVKQEYRRRMVGIIDNGKVDVLKEFCYDKAWKKENNTGTANCSYRSRSIL